MVSPWLIIHTAVASVTLYSFYYLNIQTVVATAMLYNSYYLNIHTAVATVMFYSPYYLNIHTAGQWEVGDPALEESKGKGLGSLCGAYGYTHVNYRGVGVSCIDIRTYSTQQQALSMASYNGKVT